MNPRNGWMLSLLALAACGSEPVGEPHVLVPDDVELVWSSTFNGVDDGLVALVPVDVMVYDGFTGEPLDHAEVEISVDHPDAWVLEPDQVVPVDAEYCRDCMLLWDAWRDRYFELHLDEHELEPPGSVHLQSDLWGLARAYVLVDAFPEHQDDFEAVAVQVHSEAEQDMFLLLPR